MKPNVGEDDPILADAEHAVDTRFAVGVVPPVKEEGHGHKCQVQLESAGFVGVALLAFVLDLGPQVKAEEHVALRAQYEGYEGSLVEPEVFF